jgi:heparan-alpha-glucosaminide N-acetyltransferase
VEPVSKTRIASIDAFRGAVMTLMVAEVLRLPALGKAFPQSAFWSFIAFHTSHVEWQGASLHDLIQPGFSFLVGASLPFSIANRRARGQSAGRMIAHAAWRALVLIFLGIFLRSIGKPQTYFTFEDTLTQIGLGYVFLFLLGLASTRVQVAALVLILAGYWALFAVYPAPGATFLSHWDKNTNAAWAFDRWFLNLFPRERSFEFNGGGYATLSFIPTLGTMLLGLLTGAWLKSARSTAVKLRGMIAAGVGLILLALVCQWTGLCPIVKRIWTPAFTLYSGGCVLLILSGLYAVMEWKGWRRWAFPLMVVGMNSIAIYVMSWIMEGFFVGVVNRHIGKAFFTFLGPEFEATLRGAVVMAIFWLILFWMYRRKIFIRI